MPEVVTAALVREGRVLLVHRGPHRLAHPSTWDLPGGHVEPGETEPAALVRELDEELGVAVDPGSVRLLCRLRTGGRDDPVHLSAWLVGAWRGTPTNAAPDEHDDLGWFRTDELPPLAHPQVAAALAAVSPGPRAPRGAG